MGMGLFACNLIVMGGAALSPELQVGVYGVESSRAYADAKPSPFTEIIDTARPRPVKLAQRLTPVIEQVPVQTDASQQSAYGYTEARYIDLSIPRASQTSLGVRRASETSSEKTMNVRRTTETSLAVPRASQRPATATNTLDVRRVSETGNAQVYSPVARPVSNGPAFN